MTAFLRSSVLALALLGACASSGCGGNDHPQALAAAKGHPRILLDRATLADLRARAHRRTPEWKALKRVCDSYSGHVELPDGEEYPDDDGIGAGYQGDGYLPAVYALGLCYQTTRAKRYGRTGAKVVSAMAATGSHAAPPERDSVYGIRNYGAGLAIGYDWLHGMLDGETRARVRVVLKRWIRAFEREGFGRNHPQGNYHAGYYAATGLAALAIAPDGGSPPITYRRWRKRIHEPVRRYYEANLTGGGWPEGWNYGPLGTFNMVLPLLAARTAKGVDLIGDDYRWPRANGRFMAHFMWPDRVTLEDSGAVYDADNPTAADAWFYTFQAAVLTAADDPFAPFVRGLARNLRRDADRSPYPGPAWPAWINFLFERGEPEEDVASLERSYFAPGLDMATARSSWEPSAVWSMFIGGPYVNNPDNGEEYYDKGALTIVNGDRPFLVNAGATLQRHTPGTEDGNEFSQELFDELFGPEARRSLFNVFYVDRPEPIGQEGYTRAEGANTHMSAFEDAGGSVYMRASDLRDQYPISGDKTIRDWTREIAYLRPGTFVVHDRTSVTDPSLDQWMSFHFAGRPEPVADGSYDVTTGRGYAGRVHTLLPERRDERIVDVFDSGKAFRLEVHGPHATDQDWLTVFDAAPNAGAASTAEPLDTGAGPGVLLHREGGDEAVLFATAETIRYRVRAAQTTHVIAGLQPNTSYELRGSRAGDSIDVAVRQGEGRRTSEAGVLRFHTTDDAVG
jgi:hypothetical protein